MQNVLDYNEIEYAEVLGVADDESELNIQKFRMADSIWLTKIQKVT